MNKNFENEYRKKIQEETPDLWNRIEEGLTEKKTEKQVVEFQAKTRRSKILKISSFAAACVCLAIILPVFVFTEKNYDQNSATAETVESAESAEPIVADASEDETWEEAAADEDMAVIEEPLEELESATEETAVEEIGAIETKYMKVSIQGYTQSETSIIYEMIVEENDNGEFDLGTELKMEADESFVTDLKNGKRYEIEFYYDSTKSVPYCLTDATELP